VLPDLGMNDGHFHAALLPLREIGPDGAEAVEFRVSLNVGHEERPLARVASGGELSRVMLALKTILARLDRVSTLIFDEVDAGIADVSAYRWARRCAASRATTRCSPSRIFRRSRRAGITTFSSARVRAVV
jgi:DNA repair protein RecN (Recombination protein N)